MSNLPRRTVLIGSAGVATTATLGASPSWADAAQHPYPRPRGRRQLSARILRRWARDTWLSLVAMTDEITGLTADNIDGPLASPNRSGYTSPTNIGGYLWSAVVARDLGLISRQECTRRLRRTLRTLDTMQRHEPSGMYYNWYSERTTERLTTWPADGSVVHPFLSSVDNGWLAAALMVVANADRRVARLARRILGPMNFAAYYNPGPIANRPTGLLRGGFWESEQPGSVRGNYLGIGPDVFYTGHHYDTTVSETRITTYIAIARGQIPANTYFGTWRTLPASCDWNWHEQQPVGVTRTYLGVEVFEGAYRYRGMRVVPGWGGSMFEALMPDVFVPEARWAPRSWGINHPLTVRAHREHGLKEARYGYWGFSPASDPTVKGGYREYGVDAIGLNPDGYYSDVERTNYDVGFGDCREGTNPRPDYGDGVITPHALFLAMQHEPRQAFANLRKMERNLDAYGEGGFYDAVSVSGLVAKRYLSLDQAMIMGALGNVYGAGIVRRYFTRGAVRRTIRPLIAMETFGARDSYE